MEFWERNEIHSAYEKPGFLVGGVGLVGGCVGDNWIFGPKTWVGVRTGIGKIIFWPIIRKLQLLIKNKSAPAEVTLWQFKRLTQFSKLLVTSTHHTKWVNSKEMMILKLIRLSLVQYGQMYVHSGQTLVQIGQTYVQIGQTYVQIMVKISLKCQYWQETLNFSWRWHLGTIPCIKVEFLTQNFFKIFHIWWFLLDIRASKLDIRLSNLDIRLSNLDTRLSTSGLLVLIIPDDLKVFSHLPFHLHDLVQNLLFSICILSLWEDWQALNLCALCYFYADGWHLSTTSENRSLSQG